MDWNRLIYIRKWVLIGEAFVTWLLLKWLHLMDHGPLHYYSRWSAWFLHKDARIARGTTTPTCPVGFTVLKACNLSCANDMPHSQSECGCFQHWSHTLINVDSIWIKCRQAVSSWIQNLIKSVCLFRLCVANVCVDKNLVKVKKMKHTVKPIKPLLKVKFSILIIPQSFFILI